MRTKKNFLRRITNFRVLFKYISESASIVKQGYSLKDKSILFIYYLRIPFIIIKSLFTGKEIRELEEQKKYLTGNVILKNKKGIFYCGKNILTVYTVSDTNEKKLYPYLDQKSGIFIDVGAHIGKYSIWLGKSPDNRIIAIEPEKNNFDMLQKNILVNGCTNIIAINKGAYSLEGSIPLYISEKGEGTHSVIKQNHKSNEVLIAVDTLDNLIDKLNFHDPINKIKIDVEGAELEVLKGAMKIIEKSHPSLVIEIWEKNKEHLNTITEMLQPYNYSVEQIDNDNYYFS